MAITNGKNIEEMDDGAVNDSYIQQILSFFRTSDVLIQPNVMGIISAPAVSPSNGDAYIVGAAPTGDWAGQAGKLARWAGKLDIPAWEFITPKQGWTVRLQSGVTGVQYEYNGTTWINLSQLPVHADQAAAATGLVEQGEMFIQANGTLMIKT